MEILISIIQGLGNEKTFIQLNLVQLIWIKFKFHILFFFYYEIYARRIVSPCLFTLSGINFDRLLFGSEALCLF